MENNLITEIEGLENLKNLKELYIGGNQIDPDLIEKLGGTDRWGCAHNAQKFVEYCKGKR